MFRLAAMGCSSPILCLPASYLEFKHRLAHRYTNVCVCGVLPWFSQDRNACFFISPCLTYMMSSGCPNFLARKFDAISLIYTGWGSTVCAHHIFLPCVWMYAICMCTCVWVWVHTCCWSHVGPWRTISGVSPYPTTCFETGYRPHLLWILLLPSPILL